MAGWNSSSTASCRTAVCVADSKLRRRNAGNLPFLCLVGAAGGALIVVNDSFAMVIRIGNAIMVVVSGFCAVVFALSFVAVASSCWWLS